MGRRRNKKKYTHKQPISVKELERYITIKPYFGMRQFRNTRYWVSTSGFVYYKKGGKRYKPIEHYLYRGYICVDLYIKRRGNEVKKRYCCHRMVAECYYKQDSLRDIKDLTVHHIFNKLDCSVNALYVCSRARHDLIENEENMYRRESNLDFSYNLEDRYYE